MMKTVIALAVAMTLAGCGTMGNNIRDAVNAGVQDPSVVHTELKKPITIPNPATGAMTVAVYNFRDLTGQRKNQNNIASLSSAVTQGADAYLIRSLQTVGNGHWFKVVERGGLDNIVKERQLIRQMRELYEGKDARPLPPMIFAGILLEGGIIGYDSNTMSGGSGARILGIGAQTEYRQDEVVVSLRAVSVATGEVLASVTVSKTVISFQDKLGVLRFNELGTRAVEIETGSATNESMNKAVQLAVHGAVIEMIFEGERKGHWQFKPQEKAASVTPAPVPVTTTPVVKEEKKDELVQKDAAPKAAAEVAPTPKRATDNSSSVGSGNTRQLAEDTKPSSRTTIASKSKKLVQIKDKTFVRATAVSGSTIVGVLNKGTKVEILASLGRVVKVSIPDQKESIQGWILANLVEEVKMD